MNKVALELQPCCGIRSGIGTYVYEIAKRLHDDDELEFYGNIFNFAGRHDNEESLNGISIPVKVNKLIPYKIYRSFGNFFRISYDDIFPPKADLTVFFNFIAPPKISGCIMTAIHDLTYIHYPETMEKCNLRYLKKRLKDSAERSDKILTVSNFSKSEIQKYLEVPEEKIEIVHNAPSLSKETADHARVTEKFGIHGDYILFVSTIEPRKNIVRLLHAFNYLRETKKIPHQLVLAGGKGWNNREIYQVAGQLKCADDVIFTGYVTAEEKNALYEYADAFIFPSIYEGFGIPPLEAMLKGCPVICANTASLPEVVGDAAVLINPFSIEEIAAGVLSVISDTKLRERLVQKGYERAKMFSWDKSARQLTAICKEVLD